MKARKQPTCASCSKGIAPAAAVKFNGKLLHPITCAPKAIREFGARVRAQMELLK